MPKEKLQWIFGQSIITQSTFFLFFFFDWILCKCSHSPVFAVTYFFLWDLNVCPWSMHTDTKQRVWAKVKVKRLHQPKECYVDVSLRSHSSVFQTNSKNSLRIGDSDVFGVHSVVNHFIRWLRYLGGFFFVVFFFFSSWFCIFFASARFVRITCVVVPSS